jgi:hypothetical protein
MTTVEDRLKDAVLCVAELAKEVSENATDPNFGFHRVDSDLIDDLKAAVKEWRDASQALIDSQKKPIE